MFSKEFGAKAGAAVSKKYQIKLEKMISCRSSRCRCFVKEDLQGPAQVFSCEYYEIFKNTYFEKASVKGFFWKSGRQWQIYWREAILEAFSILNFAMTECLFFLSNISLSWKSTHQVRCYHFFIVEIIV